MKTWREKLDNDNVPVVKELDAPYAGMKAGDKMLISSTKEIAEYLNNIPAGRTVTTTLLRADLAKQHQVDGTCPMTTGILLRIISETSIEDMAAGKPGAPFWRVVDPISTLATKLSCGPSFISHMRRQERT